MKLYLRQKPNKNGTTSLMLEYYYNYTKDAKGKIRHNRKYETLGIKLITNPKNYSERQFNKDALQTANDVLKAKQVEMLKSEYEIKPETKSKTNFIDYFTKELSNKSLKKSSLINYKNTLNHLINNCNPDTFTLKEIDTDFINKFKTYLNTITYADNKALKTNSKLLYFNIFKSVVVQAFKSGLINKNPFAMIKGYRKEESVRVYLTYEELQKLYDTECSKPIIARAFLFSCLTGLRFSDMQALKWNQVEKENGRYRLIFKQKKTNGQEYLNITEQAAQFLGNPENPDKLVFKGIKYNATIGNHLLKWVLKAGINKPVTYHSARHTFATMLLSNGVDLYTVSKLLGHKDIGTTQVYAKIISPKMIEAINKFPKLK